MKNFISFTWGCRLMANQRSPKSRLGVRVSPPLPLLLKKEKNMFGLVLGALYYMLLIVLGIFAIWGFGKWLWEMLTYFDS